jgi:hypothetical protein
MASHNQCIHGYFNYCTYCAQAQAQALAVLPTEQPMFKAGDRDINAPGGKLTQAHADMLNEEPNGGLAGPLDAALEGQRVLQARVAELETAALASKAQLSAMLTRNVRQENELAVLRAAKEPPSLLEQERRERQANAEVRANKLADECGRLKSENDHLVVDNARLRRKLGQ